MNREFFQNLEKLPILIFYKKYVIINYKVKKGLICVKLWIDDVRPAPAGYEWFCSVNGAKKAIERHENHNNPKETIL